MFYKLYHKNFNFAIEQFGWLFLQVSIWYINSTCCLYPLSKKSPIQSIHVYVAFLLFLCAA